MKDLIENLKEIAALDDLEEDSKIQSERNFELFLNFRFNICTFFQFCYH